MGRSMPASSKKSLSRSSSRPCHPPLQPVPEMGGRTVTLDPISRGLPGWALSLDDMNPPRPAGADEEAEEAAEEDEDE